MAQFEAEPQDLIDAAQADAEVAMQNELAEQEVLDALTDNERLELGFPVEGLQQQIQVPDADVMSDEELVSEVNEQIGSSIDGMESELVGNWRMALRYYKGRNFPHSETGEVYVDDQTLESEIGAIDPATGLSRVESKDVADMIEATMAEVMPSFEGDAIFRFAARGNTDAEQRADEQRAEDESEAVNYVLMAKNNGYVQIQSMLRDALLMRCGFVKIATQREITVESETYEQLTMEDLLVLSSDPSVQVKRNPNDGSFIVNRYTDGKRLCVESVPQEEVKMTRSWHSPFLDGIPFICHTRIVRRQELIAMGYDKDIVDGIPTESQDSNEVSVERSNFSGENQYYDDLAGNEPVRFSECYVLIDYDGDGFAERRKVCIGGQSTLMENISVPEQAFAMAVPILRSHRATGFSMFDRVKDVQDSKTEALQQHQNNLRWCNMPDQDVVFNQVNYDDVLKRRPGGTNRVKQLGAIQRNPPIPIGRGALDFMDYLDKVRSERGGASLDLQAANMQIAGDTAHGVERQVSAREQMATFMASTMVNTGVIPMLRKIHEEMRRNWDGDLQAISQGSHRSITTRPNQWPKREEVYMASAITLGDKMRRQQALNGVLGIQQKLMESGLNNVLTDLPSIYNALKDSLSIAGVCNPSQYWIDPQSPGAQQALQARAQQAEQEKAEAQQQQAIANQLQITLLQMQREMEQMRQETRFAIEVAKLSQKTQSEAAKLAEDARQANQGTATDLTDLELKYGANVPGALT